MNLFEKIGRGIGDAVSDAWDKNVKRQVHKIGDKIQEEAWDPVRKAWDPVEQYLKAMDTDFVQGAAKLVGGWVVNYVPLVGQVASAALLASAKEDFVDAAGKGVEVFARNKLTDELEKRQKQAGATLDPQQVQAVVHLISMPEPPAALDRQGAIAYSRIISERLKQAGGESSKMLSLFEQQFLGQPESREEKFMAASIKLALGDIAGAKALER